MTKWKPTWSGCVFLILVLAVNLQVSSTVSSGNRGPPASSSATTTTQILTVDVYSDEGGRGPNKTMGTYRIGDTVKYYIYLNRNSTIQETIITPDGSVWLHMAGPLNSGTIIDFFDTEYPTGTWAISVKAQVGNETASDIAPFEVVDKQPYICTKTSSLNASGSSGETKITGKVVKIYRYPVGWIHSWDVQVDNVYFGPDIRNQTVKVQRLAIERAQGSPPGYLEENITLGDEVAVYGMLNGQSVSVNGSVNYYVEKLSTLCGQAQAPGEGSKGIEVQVEEFLIVAVLMVIALILVRKKHLRSKGSASSPA